MRKVAARVLVVLFCITVSGCATGYQKISSTGNYTYMKIQDNIYKVVFSGNVYTGEARASDFALLYFAEATLEDGYKYFVPLQQKTDIKGASYKTPVDAQGTGSTAILDNPNYVYGTFNGATYYDGGQTYRFSDPKVIVTIACFKEKPENVPTMVYDAQKLKEGIEKKYNLK
jgi:hypothetical protein